MKNCKALTVRFNIFNRIGRPRQFLDESFNYSLIHVTENNGQSGSGTRVAIIGGGIASLSAAYYIQKWRPQWDLQIFEAKDRIGGTLQTTLRDDFLIEHSADMFMTDPPDAFELCLELNLENQLISPNPTNRFSSVLRNGKPIRIPAGFSLLAPNQIKPVLTSPLLSWRGKLRFLWEYCSVAKINQPDESLKSFSVRHFGVEIFERLIQPLVAGVYSADASRLSMQATMMRFVEMERNHGSLIRASMKQKNTRSVDRQSSGARYGLFVAPKNGMQTMVDALGKTLQGKKIHTKTAVYSIHQNFGSSRWNVETPTGQNEFDWVVVGTDSNVASKLLNNVDSELPAMLQKIAHGSLIVATLECGEEAFRLVPSGFGLVIPEIENRDLIACSFSSNKFRERAPHDKFLMRCFIGGANVGRWIEASDSDIKKMVQHELKSLFGYQPKPEDRMQVIRWVDCMPHYHVGHLDLVSKVEHLVDGLPGLKLIGKSYLGVGIPACIQSGKKLPSSWSKIQAQ